MKIHVIRNGRVLGLAMIISLLRTVDVRLWEGRNRPSPESGDSSSFCCVTSSQVLLHPVDHANLFTLYLRRRMSSTDLDADDLSDSSEQKSPKKQPGVETELTSLFKQVLCDLDNAVQGVASSQVMLRQELDQSLEALKTLKERTDDESMLQTLEEKSKKLVSLKRRLTLVHTIIQTCNERSKKLISNYKIPQS